MWIKPALFMYSLILFSSEGTWGCDPIKTQWPEYIAVDVFLLFFVSVSQTYEEHAWKQKTQKSHCRQDEACLSQDCTDVTVFSHWNIKKLLQKNKKIHFHISDSQLGYWHRHHLSTRFTLVHWTTSFSFFLCMSLNNKMLCLKRVINNFWILYL